MSVILEEGTKICKKCQIEKPLSGFYKTNVVTKDGYHSTCRACKRAYEKKRREDAFTPEDKEKKINPFFTKRGKVSYSGYSKI